MLANRVREFSTTTGTGTITLGGAIAGHISFADAFLVGDSVIYVIEDGDNYEIGTGTLQAASLLERTVISETLENGILTTDGAIPIALSGQARVYCAVTADFLLEKDVDTNLIREAIPGQGVRMESDVTVAGNFTVQGDFITQSAYEVNLGDATLTLLADLGVGTAPTLDAGLIVNRGAEADKAFLWDETSDIWKLDDSLSVAGDISLSGALPIIRLNDSDVATDAYIRGDDGIVGLDAHAGKWVRAMVGGVEYNRQSNSLFDLKTAMQVGGNSIVMGAASASGPFSTPSNSNAVHTVAAQNNGTSNSRLELGGYRAAADQGVLARVSGHNFQSAKSDKMAGHIDLWSEGNNTYAGQWRFYTTNDAGSDVLRLSIKGGGEFDFQGNSLSGIGGATFSGQILSPSGSQAAPTYSFSAESNTGVYSTGGNINFSLAGAARWSMEGNDFIGTNGKAIRRNIATDELFIAGGNATNNGANIRLYGGGHLTNANDMVLRAGSTPWLIWDDSASTATLTGAMQVAGPLTLLDSLSIPDASSVYFSGTSGDYATILYGDADPDLWSLNYYQNSSRAAAIEFSSTSEAAGDGLMRFMIGATVAQAFDNSGNATFAGDITITKASGSAIFSLGNASGTGKISAGASGTFIGSTTAHNTYIVAGNTNAITVSNSDLSATFAGDVSAVGNSSARSFQARQSAQNIGGKVTFVDVVGGVHRVGAYDWDLGAWLPLEISNGAIVTDPATLGVSFAGDISIGGGNVNHTSGTASLNIAGGSLAQPGANITLFSGGHATQAGDMTLNAGGTPWLSWDNSASTATFAGTLKNMFGGNTATASTVDFSNTDNTVLSAKNSFVIQLDNTGLIAGRTFSVRTGGLGYSDGTELFKVSDTLFDVKTAMQVAGSITANGGVFRNDIFDLVVGADDASTTVTNATNKTARIGAPHYTTAEENVAIAAVSSQASATIVSWGGGSSAGNAVTEQRWYGAADTTTPTGTLLANLTTSLFDVKTAMQVAGDVSVVRSGNSLMQAETTGLTNFAISRLKTPSYNVEWNLDNNDGTVGLYSQTAGKYFQSFNTAGDVSFTGNITVGGAVLNPAGTVARISDGVPSALTAPSSVATLRVEKTATTSDNAGIAITSGSLGSSYILLGSELNDDAVYFKYANNGNVLTLNYPGGNVFSVASDRKMTFAESALFSSDVTLTGMVNLGTPSELTIDASGAITVMKSYHIVDTYLDAATDELVTINGGVEGDRVVIVTASSSRVVTVKDIAAGGNLQIAGDFVMSNPADTMELIFDGINWRELSRSNNA